MILLALLKPVIYGRCLVSITLTELGQSRLISPTLAEPIKIVLIGCGGTAFTNFGNKLKPNVGLTNWLVLVKSWPSTVPSLLA